MATSTNHGLQESNPFFDFDEVPQKPSELSQGAFDFSGAWTSAPSKQPQQEIFNESDIQFLIAAQS